MENSAIKDKLDLKMQDNNNNAIEFKSSSVQDLIMQRYLNLRGLAKNCAFKIGGASLLWFLGYFNFSCLWIVLAVSVMVYMTQKRKNRHASSVIAKRANDNPKEFVQAMTEVYRMSAKDLPSWIYYPDVEKAEWLNNIIEKLWPFIGDYASNLLRNEVQTSIRQSSSLLSEFCFTDVNLGQRAPRVAGVKVHGDEHTRCNEIVMDMQIIYDGDCDIGVAVSFLEAGIKDLRLRGLMRIELKPLIDRLPLVGAVSVSFVKDPTIDFDLTELANVLDFPGFSHLLRGAIADSVGAMMVLPERYIVKMSPDTDISLLRFPLPKGMIRIHIIEAEHLAEKDKKIFGFRGKSDPFVVVKVGHRNKFTTKTVENSVNPKWNEMFESLVRDVEYGNITFDVYDDDGALSKADFLGRISISVKDAYERGVIDENVKLMDTTTGKLKLRLEWFDLSSDQKFAKEKFQQADGKTNCALLSVYVDGALNLPNNPDESYDPSPYLKITTPSGQVLKTKTASHINSPLWEENFRILLKQPLKDEVKFELKDKTYRTGFFWSRKPTTVRKKSKSGRKVEDEHNDSALLGSMKLPVRTLLDDSDLMVKKSFPLDKSNGKAVLLLRLSLRAFELKPPTNESSNNADVFKVTSGPRLSANVKAADAGAETAVAVPSHSGRSRNDSNSSQCSSGSESSYTHELSPSANSNAVNNLRQRLNAKKNVAAGEDQSPSRDAGLGRIKLSICHRNDQLIVFVHNAENLIICDEDNQTSDPYVKVHVVPHSRQRKKTKVVKNSLNPVFDEQLKFSASLKDVEHSKLNVTVKNETGFFLSFEKTLMGEVVVDMKELDLTQPNAIWYYLQLPEES